jgi:biotin carboxyl carrier protein
VKYHVVLGGESHAVTVEREGGGYRVALGEHVVHVDVGVLAEGSAYSLLIDRRSVDVAVEERPGDRLDLLIGGRRYSSEVYGEREWLARSIQPAVTDGEASVRADMAGIVREVLVAAGDTVTRGQTLLILEAMKMENEVKAGRDGRVTSVAVEAGRTVTIGDVLAEIG